MSSPFYLFSPWRVTFYLAWAKAWSVIFLFRELPNNLAIFLIIQQDFCGDPINQVEFYDSRIIQKKVSMNTLKFCALSIVVVFIYYFNRSTDGKHWPSSACSSTGNHASRNVQKIGFGLWWKSSTLHYEWGTCANTVHYTHMYEKKKIFQYQKRYSTGLLILHIMFVMAFVLNSKWSTFNLWLGLLCHALYSRTASLCPGVFEQVSVN